MGLSKSSILKTASIAAFSMLLFASYSAIDTSNAAAAGTKQEEKVRLNNKNHGEQTLAPAPWVDLQPVGSKGAKNKGFCGKKPGSNVVSRLLVTIKNHGNMAAGNFMNRMVFEDAVPSEKMVQDGYSNGGPGFGDATLSIAIPESAWKNDMARFTIIADVNHEVSETNEGNNVKKGVCFR